MAGQHLNVSNAALGEAYPEAMASSRPKRIRLRLFFEFERPRNGREVLIDDPAVGENVAVVPVKTVLTAVAAASDTSRFTPHVYDPTADCFISLTENAPDTIIAEAPAESVPDKSRALWRIDVKLVAGKGGGRSAGSLAESLVCDSSATALTGSWFGIGIARGKTASNHGSLWRSALQLGAALTFTIGRRYEKKVEGSADIYKTYRQVPCLPFEDVGAFMAAVPIDAQIVAVEYGGMYLTDFEHPKRAVYVLGSEDSGLPPALVQHAHRHVSIPTAGGRPNSLNVAAAGAIIMYDRQLKRMKADREWNKDVEQSSAAAEKASSCVVWDDPKLPEGGDD